LKEGLEKKNRYILAKISVIGKGSEKVIRVFIAENLASQDNIILK